MTADAIRRGQDAQRLLDDPLMVEARDTLRVRIMAAWEQSPARDVEGREALWRMLKSHDALFALLADAVTTGRFETEKVRDAARKAITPP